MSILLSHPVRCLVIAIALQTAGALILIVNVWGKTRKRIINMYFPRGIFANKENKSIIKLKGDRVRSCVLNIYLNRVAFVYIACGYFWGIFGDSMAWRKDVLAFAITVASTLLVIVGYLGALGFAQLRYKDDMYIHIEEVPEDVEIIPTDEEWKKDIEDIFTQ